MTYKRKLIVTLKKILKFIILPPPVLVCEVLKVPP